MTFTVAQVSDPHLGVKTELFRANFDRVVRALDAVRPDLVVASGDVSLDGADVEADLVLAASSFARMPAPVHAIPGNHDVGDHPAFAPKQPVNDARLERFRRHMGVDRWVLDRDGWRILGLDSQIMDAHPEAAAQAEMIAAALATLGDRRLAVFIHKPFFAADPDETTFDYWSVPPVSRAPLRPVMAHPNLRLVASGHLHLHYQEMRGAVSYAWAPAISFVVPEAMQAGLPGARRCAVLVHRFGDDAVETSVLEPPGMDCPLITEIQAETYPVA